MTCGWVGNFDQRAVPRGMDFMSELSADAILCATKKRFAMFDSLFAESESLLENDESGNRQKPSPQAAAQVRIYS